MYIGSAWDAVYWNHFSLTSFTWVVIPGKQVSNTTSPPLDFYEYLYQLHKRYITEPTIGRQNAIHQYAIKAPKITSSPKLQKNSESTAFFGYWVRR